MNTPCGEYVTALIAKPADTDEHRIGTCVQLLLDNREDILDYITTVMTTSRPGSRKHELAEEIWLLLDGCGVAA
ncbi:hypothetical protein NONO_c59810 [Nocardia nova SH22a]|uniref:Uncharacterized protein n=1 Tax=Nocardia nova SH22a TaxID=1415166 RepID=W5TNC1_9NOCA|nr:hypothetical protein [Nocardia nova]AHH20757.1 hypothetical protein NONO_c59810 [Nocardia nova SH22a]